MKILSIILFVLVGFTNAQTKDADQILNEVKDKFNKVKDYEVDVSIFVDVDFLKVPESKAKIYFKQPDLVKLDSEGFALLPKEGVNFSPIKLLNQDYTAIFVKEDIYDDHKVDVVKVIPNNDSSGVVLSTLWIDIEGHYIRKVETTTKSSGTLKVELSYKNKDKWGLPSSVVFSFNVSDVQLPASFSGEIGGDQKEETKKKKRGESMSGKVTLTYSNYKVNQGLSAEFFDESK